MGNMVSVSSASEEEEERICESPSASAQAVSLGGDIYFGPGRKHT